ncbi:hypothetical protein [Acidisphaera sp. S103]|uniref:hypothetical protein n=1 Tax=Acidisphaera sp. S103 TaxID=1747223 RepID=UPI00131C5E17|nr:hypothetical protein [Acidisphaera sp. S103]
MPLDIFRLVDAIDRLREGLADDQLCDGLIQRFELTGHRMVRWFIRQAVASPEEMDQMAFQD